MESGRSELDTRPVVGFLLVSQFAVAGGADDSAILATAQRADVHIPDIAGA
jgi:hypothetical protein